MSADEDTELRDLVAQTLEANGILGKIRAQLRSNVFLALEEQESVRKKAALQSQELKTFMSTKEGRTVTGLVREFLDHFGLDFTRSVFDPETGSGEYYEGRSSLARDLDIIESGSSSSQPLLAEIVKRSSGGGAPTPRGRSGSGTEDYAIQDLSTKHIMEAREKFEQYDADNSGTIEKDELRELFRDMFPNFHKNMLDRYVNDEFRAIDKDFSNTIDFEEFLGMYKRLFILCKSVVSHDVSDITLASPRRFSDTPSRIPAPLKKEESIEEKEEDEKKEKVEENLTLSEDIGENIEEEITEDLEKEIQLFLSSCIDKALSSTSSGSLNSGVDSKNKRNLDSDKTSSSKTNTKSPPGVSKDNDFFGSDPEDDPFFDDPLPISDKAQPLGSDRGKSADSKAKSGSGGMSSLSGLPSLTPQEGPKSPKGGNVLEKDIKAIDKKIADLGFDVPDDDDYDDDFESSKSDDSSVSPFGHTPRSARSDHNVKSIEDEMDEEIEEEISVADDLLKSDNSGMDDLTTDRTVSPADQSNAFDYMEDVLGP